jgi:hypothetical protein
MSVNNWAGIEIIWCSVVYNRSLNKSLTTKHYFQNRRFGGWGRGKIIPTISTVLVFNPTVKIPRLRCIQFGRSQEKILFTKTLYLCQNLISSCKRFSYWYVASKILDRIAVDQNEFLFFYWLAWKAQSQNLVPKCSSIK